MAEAYERDDAEVETVSIERFLRGRSSQSSANRPRLQAGPAKTPAGSLPRKQVELELALRNEMLLREAVQAENECLKSQLEERALERTASYVRLRSKEDARREPGEQSNRSQPADSRSSELQGHTAFAKSLLEENRALCVQVESLKRLNGEFEEQLTETVEGLRLAGALEGEVERLRRLCADRDRTVERLKEEIIQHYKELRMNSGSEDSGAEQRDPNSADSALKLLFESVHALKLENAGLREKLTEALRRDQKPKDSSPGTYEKLRSEIRLKDAQISKLIAQVACM